MTSFHRPRFTDDEHVLFTERLEQGEYNLFASRILDAHHEPVDENPQDGCADGTCEACGFADGWREDMPGVAGIWGHTTLATEREAREWVKAQSVEIE